MSDTDIAILLKDNAPKGRSLMHDEDFLSYRIAKALGVRKVDLVNLNSQGMLFRHNVLRTGRLIYDSDPSFRTGFETRLISNFCDFEPTLRFMGRFYFEGYKKRLAGL